MNPTSSPTGTTRRQLVTTGAFGAAAAAFLAACGTKTDKKAGQSGDDPTTTAVPPEAPLPEVTEADRANDTDLLRTATSMELLAAQLYEKYGPEVDDADWKADLARFAADHAAAARTFQDETPADDRYHSPNQWLIEESIDPVRDQLDGGSDAVVLEFFASLESTFAATYITAVSSFSQVEGRSQFAGFAEAAARRNALLGNAGEGAPPQAALFPLQDLIPNDAYVTITTDDPGVDEDTEDEPQN